MRLWNSFQSSTALKEKEKNLKQPISKPAMIVHSTKLTHETISARPSKTNMLTINGIKKTAAPVNIQ